MATKQTNKEIGTIIVMGSGMIERSGAFISETPNYVELAFSNNPLSSSRSTRRIPRAQIVSYSSPNTRGFVRIVYKGTDILQMYSKVEYTVENGSVTIFHSAKKKDGATFDRTVTLTLGENVVIQPATVRTNEKAKPAKTGAKKASSSEKIVQMKPRTKANAA